MDLYNSERIDRDLFLGWAKVKRDKEKKGKSLNEFHAVIYHLLDTGACAFEILEREPLLIENLGAPFLKVYSPNLTQKILSFFAAMHDLGKLSPVFQSLLGEKNQQQIPITQWMGNGLFLQAIKENFGQAKKVCHGYISSYSLLEYFFDIQKELKMGSYLVRYAIAAGHHHDKSVPYVTDKVAKWNNLIFFEYAKKYFGNEDWKKLRIKLIENVWNVIVGEELKIDQFILEENFRDDSLEYQIDLQFAGFVCAADWIASTEKFFAYAKIPTTFLGLNNYFTTKKKEAAKVLSGKIYWGKQNSQFFNSSNFEAIFKFSPRFYQQEVLKFVEKTKNPSLIILEAPMGMGKTEAALSFLLSPYSKKSRGLYFALPTQATSNQMYGRVSAMLNYFFQEKNITVQNQLLHANKMWNDTFLESLIDSDSDDMKGSYISDETVDIYEENDEKDYFTEKEASVVGSSWHKSSKTGLLAEFGVGTVDQVLNCVLIKEKHYFVKHFALAGKTIILDEIHAYDSYMDKLICHLLEWLALHKCQVILLSATLPKEKREKFLAAFSGKKIETLSSGFPRISVASRSEKHFFEEKVTSSDDLKSKKTPVSLIKIKKVDDIVQNVMANLKKDKNGLYQGVVGIVCNTVKTAQKVYEAFEEYGLSHNDLLLFHARFNMSIRLEKEEFIKNKLGKDEFKKFIQGIPSQRPSFKIVIATQVIEQSLDIDFDDMYTFLCPIDLILQRMGRHYRRCRWDMGENYQFNPSTFGIFYEECDEENLPKFVLSKGCTYVYYEYTLLKTFLVLKNFLSTNYEIDDVFDLENLISKVYSDDKSFVEIKRLQDARLKLDEDTYDKGFAAASVLLNLPHKYISYAQNRNWFLGVLKERQNAFEFKSQTRLFDKSIQLLILIKHEAQFYCLSSDNSLVLIEDIYTEEKNELKKMIQTQVSIPYYIWKEIETDNGDLLSLNESLKKSKYLKYYNVICLDWNGEYAFKNLKKSEIRNCARMGFQFFNL